MKPIKPNTGVSLPTTPKAVPLAGPPTTPGSGTAAPTTQPSATTRPRFQLPGVFNSGPASYAEGTSLPIVELSHGSYGGSSTAGLTSVAYSADWPATVAPDTHDFWVYSLGTRNSGGFSVSISRVVQTTDKVIAYFQERTPPPGVVVTMALTQPFAVFATPKLDLPLVAKADPVYAAQQNELAAKRKQWSHELASLDSLPYVEQHLRKLELTNLINQGSFDPGAEHAATLILPRFDYTSTKGLPRSERLKQAAAHAQRFTDEFAQWLSDRNIADEISTETLSGVGMMQLSTTAAGFEKVFQAIVDGELYAGFIDQLKWSFA